jgi:hypothetical protein
MLTILCSLFTCLLPAGEYLPTFSGVPGLILHTDKTQKLLFEESCFWTLSIVQCFFLAYYPYVQTVELSRAHTVGEGGRTSQIYFLTFLTISTVLLSQIVSH